MFSGRTPRLLPQCMHVHDWHHFWAGVGFGFKWVAHRWRTSAFCSFETLAVSLSRPNATWLVPLCQGAWSCFEVCGDMSKWQLRWPSRRVLTTPCKQLDIDRRLLFFWPRNPSWRNHGVTNLMLILLPCRLTGWPLMMMLDCTGYRWIHCADLSLFWEESWCPMMRVPVPQNVEERFEESIQEVIIEQIGDQIVGVPVPQLMPDWRPCSPCCGDWKRGARTCRFTSRTSSSDRWRGTCTGCHLHSAFFQWLNTLHLHLLSHIRCFLQWWITWHLHLLWPIQHQLQWSNTWYLHLLSPVQHHLQWSNMWRSHLWMSLSHHASTPSPVIGYSGAFTRE